MDWPDRAPAGVDIDKPSAARTDEFVRAWATAIHSACFVPIGRDELCELLHRLTGELTAALHADPFDPAAGYQAGAALVEAGYTAPEALARTITMLNTRLLAELRRASPRQAEFRLTGQSQQARLTALVEAVAAGFTRALRAHTLTEQEQIRLARAEAEQALRDSEARFRYAASHDQLTDLPNQQVLTERLQLLTDRPGRTRLGVCCIDLDRFEAINDALGLPVGDRLLVAVAERLRQLATERRHLAVRRSGDQFAILVEETTSAEDVTKVADRVLAVLAEPFHIDGYELSVSASAGVVETPAAGSSPTEVMRAADVALHWAKADGGDRWMLFEEPRRASDAARYRLSAAMPAALRRGEFVLVYQPLMGLETSTVAGVEALARWEHPEYGTLGADRFVAQAEHTGLIVPLGLRLLRQACEQAVQWYEQLGDSAPYVSVNLSARQLHQSGLVGEIVELLDRTGLPPRLLQLEITESAVVVTDGEILGRLTALSNLGIRITIDDFGTGYSNFAYLYDLPVHGIKLAGELLRDVGRGSASRARAGYAVLTALISLGRTLGLTVTAEGVETPTQAEWLRAVGCHIGQGWYFGRPASADRLTIHSDPNQRTVSHNHTPR